MRKHKARKTQIIQTRLAQKRFMSLNSRDSNRLLSLVSTLIHTDDNQQKEEVVESALFRAMINVCLHTYARIRHVNFDDLIIFNLSTFQN